MAVRVVVDSSAGLPPEVVRELDITVADMHVMGSGEDKGTSGLSSLELAACYARQLERGGDDGVIALHLSKALSSTWSAAVAASAVFPGTVKVVETDAAGMTIGAAASRTLPITCVHMCSVSRVASQSATRSDGQPSSMVMSEKVRVTTRSLP